MGDKALEPGALDAAEQFALHDYTVALNEGPLDGAAADAVYQKLADLTGLGERRIAEWHGRIPLVAYVRDARRSEGRVVSRYDAGISQIDPNPLNEGEQDDPVLDGTIAPFTSAFVAYAADELGYKGFDVATMLGLQTSAGASPVVVGRLQSAVAKILVYVYQLRTARRRGAPAPAQPDIELPEQ